MEVKGATESMRVSGYMHAIRDRQLIEQLNRVVPQTMKEAEQRSRDFVRGKEAAALAEQMDGRSNMPWRHEAPARYAGGPSRGRVAGWNKEEGRLGPYQREEREQTFTALIKTPCEILATEEAARNFVSPTSRKAMLGPTDRYCEYHQATGHDTDECLRLRKRIEGAVRSGELAHLVKNDRRGNGKAGRKLEINIVQIADYEGQSGENSWKKVPLVFHPGSQSFPSEDPLIIKCRTETTLVARMLVDTGAAAEVMYEHFFLNLPQRIKGTLTRTSASLETFYGNEFRAIGKIALPITIGAYPTIRTERVEFYLVRGKSKVDMIMGRPGLKVFQAIPSTIHSILFLPTIRGMAEVKGEKEISRGSKGEKSEETCIDVSSKNNCVAKLGIIPEWKDKEIRFPRRADFTLYEAALLFRRRVRGTMTPQMMVDTKTMYGHRLKMLGYADQQKMKRKGEPTPWFKGKITLQWGTILKPRMEVASLGIRTATSRDAILGRLNSGSSGTMTSAWSYVSGRITAIWAERQRKGSFPSRREMKQMPNCLSSKGLAEAEWGYTLSEGLTLALTHLAQQSQRYFQTYEIIILIDMLIKEGIARPGEPGRLAKWAIKSAKWAIKSGKHGIRFRPETDEKGPILANFIAEVPIPLTPKRKVTRIGKREGEKKEWVPYTNGASIEDGSGTWFIQANPGSMESTHVLKHNPRGTNDVAEHEALIIRPKLAKETGEEHLGVRVDPAL